MLSLFYSQLNRWQNNAGEYSLISPNILLGLAFDGTISFYNSDLGIWLKNVKKVQVRKFYRLYGRQLLVVQEQKFSLYPDILEDAAPKLIADGLENAEHPPLLPNKQILYYNQRNSALILTAAQNEQQVVLPLFILPPKEFYQKTPRAIKGYCACEQVKVPEISCYFHNVLVFFDVSGKNIYSIPLPSRSAKSFAVFTLGQIFYMPAKPLHLVVFMVHLQYIANI